MQLLPVGKQQFFDQSGAPLVAGTVYFYDPGTTVARPTWQDPDGSIENPNPVILDGAGSAVVWGSGSYRQVVYDQFNNQIWDLQTTDLSSSIAQLSADLSASTGATIIGFEADGASSVTRTVSQQLQDLPTVLMKGADPTGCVDATAAFQAAIDEYGQFFVPPGTYTIDSIVMRTNTRMFGLGRPVLKDPELPTGLAMILLCDTGIVENVVIEGFDLVGNNVSGRHGIMANANYDASNGYQGGSWFTRLVDISVKGFAGHQIWFRGGTAAKIVPEAPSGNLQPNQFISLTNVRAQARLKDSYALVLSGQNGQFDISSASLFEHTSQLDKAVYINRYMDATGAEGTDDGRAYSITFQAGTSLQKGQFGAHVRRGYNVRFDGVYLEQNIHGVFFDLSAEECYFSGVIAAQINDGKNGDYAIRAANGAVGGAITLKIGPTYLYGGGSTGIDGGQSTGVTVHISSPPSINGAYTTPYTGLTYQASTSTTTLNTYSHGHVLWNGGVMDSINSKLPPGATLTVLVGANGATINGGAGITLGNNRSTLTINKNSALSFFRVDLGGTWLLMQAPSADSP